MLVIIQRGAYHQAAAVHQMLAVFFSQQVAHIKDEVRRLNILASLFKRQLLRLRFILLLFRDVALLLHQLQGQVLTVKQGVHMRAIRRKIRRTLNNGSQQRGLSQGDVLGGLAKIQVASRFHAVSGRSVRNFIQVHLQDLLLAELALDLKHQNEFTQFARQGFFRAENGVLDQLRSQGRRARAAAAHELVHDSLGQALQVKTGMFIESTVLQCNDGLRNVGRQFLDLDNGALLLAGNFV